MAAFSRKIYLKTVPIPEALKTVKQQLDRKALVRSENIPTDRCAGRVTSGPVHARLSSPTFHSAAMDGIAVHAEDTFAAREGRPVRLVRGEDYVPVNTGNPMPGATESGKEFNAVIMIEHVRESGEDGVEIEAPAFPWQHVRRIGEDIVATELLFPRNHRLSPYDVGSLLGACVWDVDVHERIRVSIMPTGDEVLDFRDRPEPAPGQYVESNSQVIGALLRQVGAEVTRIPPVPDDPEKLAAAFEDALASDAHIVVVCAGSSAGSKDFTRSIIERYGEVVVHGITAMPGKPSILGVASAPGSDVKKLVVGAPGYPVSAVVCAEELLVPLACWLERRDVPERPRVAAEMARKAPSKLGMEEFLRLSLGHVGDESEKGKYVATPLGRGAGCISTMSRAQAVARIPVNSEGVTQGGSVEAELLVPRQSLDSILVVVGSHDNTLDLISDELMGLDTPYRMSSSHVGSMGGLAAVGSGSCLMAGCHLFDPNTGDYNFPFIDRYLSGKDVLVINLAIRHQGLIVPKGNPKGISGVEDLAREDVSFINRQRGAGTRILLDYHLDQAGIAATDVRGYAKEEYTHMAVAVNVLTGAADCGLGIHAAAKALGLDFVPMARERYDLIVPRRFANDPRVLAVRGLLEDEEVKGRIRELGGYETDLTGREMAPGDGLPEA